MSFAVNIEDLSRRAANYVDKILKGSNPANLPVDEPVRYDLVINLKAARPFGADHPRQCTGASGQGHPMTVLSTE